MNIINADQFASPERQRWQLIASGYKARASDKSKPAQWEAMTSKKGYAIRNGGIVMPREWDLPTGNYYYRFVDSTAYAEGIPDGPANPALFGGWWIEYEVMRSIVSFFRAHDDPKDPVPLERVVSYFLALPEEWGDRAWLFRACLGFPLRAWRGRGRAAQWNSGKYIPPQHRQDIFQCLIPGDPQQRASAFLPWIPSSNLIHTAELNQSAWFR